MILLTYGTRPEYIKIFPLAQELKKNNIEYKVLFTGQHQNIIDTEYDFIINFKSYTDNRLNDIIINCLLTPIEYIQGVDYMIVQGDTTSVLGLSLLAFHNKIKIIHLESGLRTYDFNNPYPEEMNRQLVSRLSSINLCPTILNKNNLKNENVIGDSYIVGNTVIDNLIKYKNKCEYQKKILVTFHRRENHELISEWFKVINKISIEYADYEFILPIHPNPDVFKHKDLLTNVNVINPLKHEDLMDLMIQTSLVITDSGGIQEECSFLNKKCIVCRKLTERPEPIGMTTFLAESPEMMYDLFNEHIKSCEVNYESPFGDGEASKKITEILKKYLD